MTAKTHNEIGNGILTAQGLRPGSRPLPVGYSFYGGSMPKWFVVNADIEMLLAIIRRREGWAIDCIDDQMLIERIIADRAAHGTEVSK